MRLITHIYETPDRATLLKTIRGGFSFSTGEHGFRAWNATLDVGPDEAQAIYNWPGVPHVEVVDVATEVIWEGRLEDIAISGGQVTLGAFGYWRALTDVPYTALWSKTGSGGWRAVTEDDNVTRSPSKFNMDNNNRVYISLKKNQTYGTTGARVGTMAYLLPHNSERDLVSISYDYDVTLPTNWRARILSWEEGFTGASVDQTITGNGSQQTGSHTVTLGATQQIVSLDVDNNTGSNYTNTAEDDAWYAKLTNIRILTQTTQVLASDIAGALATYVNAVNSGQLSASSALIDATSADLQDELYEDAKPTDILDRLALLHNYEAGVWTGRRLHFRERGSDGKAWFVNVRGVLDAQRSLDRVANSVYATYKDAGGRTLRTSASDDDASQSRFGLTRRDTVSVDTTSSTEAETHRDAMLSDRADDVPRIGLEIDHLEDEGGGRWPLYHIRAGDTVTFRDLLPYALSADDAMSTFVVGETDYSMDTPEQITIRSREPLPSLEVLVARREAGIRR